MQEPTDLSILLEWSVTTSSREESHLELGFETAMSGSVLSVQEIELLTSLAGQRPAVTGPVPLLPDRADPYFRVLQARGD